MTKRSVSNIREAGATSKLGNDVHSLSVALSQFAECIDTVSSGVQDVLASAVSRRPLLAHQSRHCCSRPPLQLWAPVLARRLRCRNVHHTDAPLNQLVGPSHENSLALSWERSAAEPPSADRRFLLSPGCSPCSPWSWSWWRWTF